MKQRDFTSAKAKEALLKDKDKFCGECCWFYAEDTYGYGMCPFQFAEVRQCDRPCNSEDNFVSKEEMRRHLVMLKEEIGWLDSDPLVDDVPDGKLVSDAIKFAYKYIGVFSQL